MKTGFGTVLYKESFKFIEEFSESINNQDCCDFDVLLLNDDLNNEELNIAIKSFNRNIVLFVGKPNSTISELRFQLIKNAKEKNYDLLVLGDLDDTFSNNRVSAMKSNYSREYSFYYNDLYYFHKEIKYFNCLPEYTDKYTDILEHNYLGLSNTALNLNNIDFELIESLNVKNAFAFDWYMFSILLMNGHKGEKVDCRTYYRIYENNTAGEFMNTINDIYKEINIKINHYSLLNKFNYKLEELLVFYKELKIKGEQGMIDLLSYVDAKNDFWWGHIKLNKKITKIRY